MQRGRTGSRWALPHISGLGKIKKGKGSPYSITERRVPELIPVLGSQPASDVSHKPSGRLPLLSARPAVTPATLKRAAASFAAGKKCELSIWRTMIITYALTIYLTDCKAALPCTVALRSKRTVLRHKPNVQAMCYLSF